MGLTEYKRKRNFRRTPEPKGKPRKKTGCSYVIQKHAASHLHYDLRLELDGTLKSWAVPKGPCLDPSQKRLAIHVEDHPVEYGTFEGIIPDGEYGGGTVMLWDEGHWEPQGDARQGYREGKLKFTLHGEKLRGGWMLVRRSSAQTTQEQKTWFLIKERDGDAQLLSEGDTLEEQPLSVVSGRSLEEIASAKDRVWGSSKRNGRSSPLTAKPNAKSRAKTPARTTKARASKRTKSRPTKKPPSSDVEGAIARKLPATITPQLATLTKSAPEGDQWLHEIKFDGYRMICRIDDGQVQFISRNQQDWTDRLQHLVPPTQELPVKQAVLDGEVVAMSPDGNTDFQLLQNAFRDGHARDLQYFVFDLLYLDGRDLTKVVIEDRKRLLSDILSAAGKLDSIHYTDHVVGSGPEFFKQASKLHLEGIISKRRDRGYSSGRSYDWLKVKCVCKDEFVIGGYTDPESSRTGFGALLLGHHDNDKLVYAGKVGTGFNERTLVDLAKKLRGLERRESPFSNLRAKTGVSSSAHWVDPKLVAQIQFSNWTRDGLLRHPSFQGLREDKLAKEVVRDEPIANENAVAASTEQRTGKSLPMNSTSKRADRSKILKKTRSRKSISRLQAASEQYQADKGEFEGVRLTSPDKHLFATDDKQKPGSESVSKLELAQYYLEIAEWILPHVANRPLVLVRCPDGQQHECFYQKHPGIGTPTPLRQIPVREKSKTGKYLVVDDTAGLISLAQIAALEIHAWGSHADTLELPDRLIFDLDPDPKVTWERVVESAHQIRKFLNDIGLESFVKTTGGKGLHLVVPIQARHDWDEAKEFCKRAAELIVTADPKRYTSNMSKAARTGKIFIDYLRNGRGATSVAPFSTRAKPGAPVSTPLTWKECTPKIRSDQFNVHNLPTRLASLKADPWEGIDSVRQSLSAKVKRHVGM